MHTTTEVVWALMPGQTKYPSDTVYAKLAEQIEKYQAEGKTNRETHKVINPDGTTTVKRLWIDKEAAADYLKFVNQFNPVSVRII